MITKLSLTHFIALYSLCDSDEGIVCPYCNHREEQGGIFMSMAEHIVREHPDEALKLYLDFY